MISNLWPVVLVAFFALIVSYVVSTIWTNIAHSRRARQWGCKPAVIRPYRLPFGLDILKRYTDAAASFELQNDDVRIFEEMACRGTWNQQICGSWSHVTTDPENVQAILAKQFQDFSVGRIRYNCFYPFFGPGIFTLDGSAW